MRKILLFAAVLAMLAGVAMAQDGTLVEIDFAAVEAILATGLGGLAVTALVALVKRWVKAQGFAVIIISVVVAAAATAAYLVPTGWDWFKFLYLTLLVALGANGIYLNPKTRTP